MQSTIVQRRGSAVSPAWWLVTLLCWGVAAWSLTNYATFDAARFFDEQRETYIQHWLVMYGHTLFAPLTLLIGPLQFHPGLRNRWPRVHRTSGMIYLAAVVISGLGALSLAPVAYGYASTRIGFAALGVLWLGSAAIALYSIKRGDVDAHRRWMMRNFSLTFAAVTLRLWLPVLMSLDVSFDVTYAIAAWSSWVPNLIAMEMLLRRSAKLQPVTA
ncbi:putative membrane protein [Povalibacter uvarum]|uniref:Putative membrane protein n=1 Tax=Povalibacter uvarum TaxID=732238 RepID=A0A841HFX7_9GAMM|nr:DUF2306 domain-containing protein [Povalibacter uvarum]MBB6091208.1 putative membrane protein [Povalibacter uvarum]